MIHILPTLLLPENFTLLNSAEKILLSVNATRFVSLLRSANLSTKYVGEPGKNKDHEDAWTILAPTDEVIDMMEREGHGPVSRLDDGPFKDASPLASLLQYHILPGKLSPKAIKDGMLVGTEMRTSALRGERQRLEVGVSDRLNQLNWADLGAGDISFGGATVLGKPGELPGIESGLIHHSGGWTIDHLPFIVVAVASGRRAPDGSIRSSIIHLCRRGLCRRVGPGGQEDPWCYLSHAAEQSIQLSRPGDEVPALARGQGRVAQSRSVPRHRWDCLFRRRSYDDKLQNVRRRRDHFTTDQRDIVCLQPRSLGGPRLT